LSTSFKVPLIFNFFTYSLARAVLDKINLIGDDKVGLYLFDRHIQQATVENAASENTAPKTPS